MLETTLKASAKFVRVCWVIRARIEYICVCGCVVGSGCCASAIVGNDTALRCSNSGQDHATVRCEQAVTGQDKSWRLGTDVSR